MKNLATRIEALRKDTAFDPAKLPDYLKMTQEALRASVSEYHKCAVTLLPLVIVCELLLRSLVAELSFAGLKVRDLSLIQKALPVGIAYAYYSLVSVVAYRRLLEQVHDSVFEMAMPAMYKYSFEWFVLPPTPFHLDKIFESSLEGPMRVAFSIMRVPFLAVIVFGPPAYVTYVLVRYFSVYGLKDFYLWGSAIGSCLFLIQGLLALPALNRLTQE